MNQKGFVPILLLVGLIFLVIPGGGVYWLFFTDHPQYKFGVLEPGNIKYQRQLNEESKQVINKTIDQTTNWKTYTNTKYGFFLRYPSSWQIVEKENNPVVGLYPSIVIFPQPGIIISVLERPFVMTTPQPPAIEDVTTIKIDEAEGSRFKAQGAPFATMNVELPYQTKTLLISAALHKDIDLNIYDQILSTFKFN